MPIFSIGQSVPRFNGAHHFIAYDATLVGDITLENDVNVWFQVVIRAENDRIHIGEGCNIQDGS
ncbi:MAG: gamma carbonic anhydrase family protein, partial [Stellaceae bacterium]